MSRVLKVKKILEKDVMKLTTDWLSAKRIFYIRTNTYSGRVQSGAWLRQGKKGMADILVLVQWKQVFPEACFATWLELKKPAGGIQSLFQKEFQLEVEALGHRYRVIRSLEDLEAAFK